MGKGDREDPAVKEARRRFDRLNKRYEILIPRKPKGLFDASITTGWAAP
ncbi:MAG: hypothetical protein NT076_03295 [Candidatus Pacearchaeota archaeon]|nr:hypothetical protein [Candidatus Pacearchaeota archaeon]